MPPRSCARTANRTSVLLLDASVWVAALDRDDRFHSAARQIATAGKELAALDLTLYEVANAVRRRNAQAEPVVAAVQAVLAASSVIEAARVEALALAAEIALEHDITVYDSLYVAVARQHGWTLVSADIKDLVGRDLAITPDQAVAPAPGPPMHNSPKHRPIAHRPPVPAGPYLVVGLARSGLAAARLLSERGELVIGVDAGTIAADAGAAAAGVPGAELHAHDDGLAHLERVRAVVKSPGVPAEASVIESARARGLPVLGELELAWRLLENEFIAVTGTNGKTTAVELIGHIHREAGLPVAVAGNVGVALSGLVGRVDAQATIVCEASSFQLEDATELAPEAAVLLNVTPDHLDRHGTLEAYRDAKLRIFTHQARGAVAALPLEIDAVPPNEHIGTLGGASARDVVPSDVELVRFGEGPLAECALHEGALWWKGEQLLHVQQLSLRGAHNVRNALAAAAVCLARGIEPDAVRAALRSFAGVAHRLQEVAQRDGVLYVNDSKATNIASTIVALQAFPEGGVHLILGGQGKGQDFSALAEPVTASCRGVYLIGEDAPAIARALETVNLAVTECGDLVKAVDAASRAASAGEVVLLSPACASFDQFADFEERGERFAELARGPHDRVDSSTT